MECFCINFIESTDSQTCIIKFDKLPVKDWPQPRKQGQLTDLRWPCFAKQGASKSQLPLNRGRFFHFQYIFPMLESPRCRSQEAHKRTFTTNRLFTKLDMMETTRDIKTSMASRAKAFPHLTKNQSLDNSKENMNYAVYLSKVKSALKIDEKSTVSKYLLSLRKEYDKMAKNIKQQQSQINTMNKDIQFMRDKNKGQTSMFSDIKLRVELREKQLQEITAKQVSAQMETKVMENIITRMKHDQLKSKQDNRVMEGKVKEKLKCLKGKEEQILQWDKAIHKTAEKVSEIKKEFVSNMEERLLKLHDFQSRVGDLQEHEKFEMERKQRTYELLSMESNDIMDAKNVVLRDVLMANKLLGKLLEGKINELLARYEDFQKSYHIIRNETNISDPQSMTKKFFSYTEALEAITSTITFYEKRQEELSAENEELKRQKREKLAKMLEEEKILSLKMTELDLEKEELCREKMEKQLIRKKVAAWAAKNSALFGLTAQNQTCSQVEAICKYLVEEAEKLKGASLSDRKFQNPGVRMKKVMREFSVEDEKIRRSEAQEVSENNMRENLYLTYERNKVKKNHFMIKTTTPRNNKIA